MHFGRADEILINRHKVLLQAYDKNPARFNKKIPTLKKLRPVYINPPKIESEKNIGKNCLQREASMA